jgi:integrase/recombinase XerD
MAQPSQPISPLRQRMIEDMRIRKLARKTQSGYIRAVKKLADFMGHSHRIPRQRKTCGSSSCN